MGQFKAIEEATTKIEEVKLEAKWNFTKRNSEFCVQTRLKKLKEERDERLTQAAINIHQSSYTKLRMTHEDIMSEIFLLTKESNEGSTTSS